MTMGQALGYIIWIMISHLHSNHIVVYSYFFFRRGNWVLGGLSNLSKVFNSCSLDPNYKPWHSSPRAWSLTHKAMLGCFWARHLTLLQVCFLTYKGRVSCEGWVKECWLAQNQRRISCCQSSEGTAWKPKSKTHWHQLLKEKAQAEGPHTWN